jgi:hypothetical protein
MAHDAVKCNLQNSMCEHLIFSRPHNEYNTTSIKQTIVATQNANGKELDYNLATKTYFTLAASLTQKCLPIFDHNRLWYSYNGYTNNKITLQNSWGHYELKSRYIEPIVARNIYGHYMIYSNFCLKLYIVCSCIGYLY